MEEATAGATTLRRHRRLRARKGPEDSRRPPPRIKTSIRTRVIEPLALPFHVLASSKYYILKSWTKFFTLISPWVECRAHHEASFLAHD